MDNCRTDEALTIKQPSNSTFMNEIVVDVHGSGISDGNTVIPSR